MGVGFIGLGWAVESYRVRSVTVVGGPGKEYNITISSVAMVGGIRVVKIAGWGEGLVWGSSAGRLGTMVNAGMTGNKALQPVQGPVFVKQGRQTRKGDGGGWKGEAEAEPRED